MAEPTPGPWVQRTLLVVDAQGRQICHCTRWEHLSPRPEIAERNARLISAAPELLEALKRAREALKALEEVAGTWELYQHSPEMQAINDAIAKATGRG